MIETAVTIQTPDGSADAVLLHPEGQGPWPGVLHLTDVFGIRPAHMEMARRLAQQGYAVLVPNLFYRSARPPVFDFTPQMGDPRTMERFRELTGPLTPEAQLRDASAYVDALAAQPAVGPGPISVVGHCFSGSMALRAAAERPDRIGVVASFHGGSLCTDAPTSPHLLLSRVRAELYFGHADQDRSMPAEAIARLEEALAAWGGRWTSEVYVGASHGWTVPGGQMYHPEQAERAFETLCTLLGRVSSGVVA